MTQPYHTWSKAPPEPPKAFLPAYSTSHPSPPNTDEWIFKNTFVQIILAQNTARTSYQGEQSLSAFIRIKLFPTDTSMKTTG